MAKTYTLAVAPNGARKTKRDHPGLPITAAETAAVAAAAADDGATMIHAHVRDRDGAHILDADAYRETTAAIRREVGNRIVVQITTEAVGRYTPEEQMAVVADVKPEAASLALREVCPDDGAVAAFARFMADLEAWATVPQIILFDVDDVVRLCGLVDRGALAAPDVLFVLGRYAAPDRRTSARDLLPFLEAAAGRLPSFSVCAFGPEEAAACITSVLLGGGARVGFENNLHLPDGTLAPDNAALIEAVAGPLRLLDRHPESADAYRERLARRR